MQSQTKKLTTLSMLGALAYLVMVFMRVPLIPAAEFLKYDPKDAIIVISGFLFGPFSAFLLSFVVSLVEMFTVSTTGIIGFLMNIISTSAFACVASAVYKRKRTLSGAIIGLVAGAASMCAAMLLWNYIITPIYMGVPREVVAGMLPTVFLPFNLLKSSINGALTMIIYKPVKKALAKAGFAEPQEDGIKGKINIAAVLGALFVIMSCIILILVIHGNI